MRNTRLYLLRLRVFAALLGLLMAQQRPAHAIEILDETALRNEGLKLMRRSYLDEFEDIALVNHRGEKVRFFTDLVKNRAVVINFFYTRCDGTCPLANGRMAQLRRALQADFGRSITLLSISVDAEHDTPAIVSRYARMATQESAEPDMPDWQFLTGDPEAIYRVRQQLGYVSADPAKDRDPSQHGAMIMMGNHATGRWGMINSALELELLMSRVKRLAGWTQGIRYGDIRRKAEATYSGQPAFTARPAEEPEGPEQPLPILGRAVADIEATERSGRPVKLSDLRGKVVVAGHFYTVCPHGSKAVIATMSQLNQTFGNDGRFHQVAFSPASERETPAFFQAYARNLGLTDDCRWWFITAPEVRLAGFITHNLGLQPPRSIPPEERLNPFDLYEHDLRVVLIDAQGRIRGRYEVFNANPDISQENGQLLIRHVRQLLEEPIEKKVSAN
jgi:cytochrome oxidase Cu insertion factor (SCO1/SenC/PrrC family)